VLIHTLMTNDNIENLLHIYFVTAIGFPDIQKLQLIESLSGVQVILQNLLK